MLVLVKNSIYKFSCSNNLFYSLKLSILFIKSIFGIILIYLPSFYYVKISNNLIYFIFLSKFFYRSFISHIFNYYNYVNFVYFIKLKIRGLGYRICQLSDDFYYFFFNYTNFFYLYVPTIY
jgi:hypothetical protein